MLMNEQSENETKKRQTKKRTRTQSSFIEMRFAFF